mgnify:FL=1
MKPLNGFILVKADKELESTKSGILIAKNALKLPQTGTILAVSDEEKELKAGDRVAFLRYATIDTDDELVKVCKKSHIVGILDGSS